MAVILVPRRDISKFERMHFFEADEPERTNIRKISLAGGKTTVNGSDAETSDEVAINRDDGQEDTSDNTDTDTSTDGTDDNEVAMEPDDTTDDTGNNDDGDEVALEPDEDDTSGDDTDSGENDSDSDSSSNSSTDAVRKRALFSRIESVYNAVDKYADKLNKLMINASDNIGIFRDACDNLDAIRGYTYDYMIIRFSKASYAESMLFYQRILTAVQLALEDLSVSLNEAANKDSDKEQNSKSKKG